jgi:hypothetical protein
MGFCDQQCLISTQWADAQMDYVEDDAPFSCSDIRERDISVGVGNWSLALTFSTHGVDPATVTSYLNAFSAGLYTTCSIEQIASDPPASPSAPPCLSSPSSLSSSSS